MNRTTRIIVAIVLCVWIFAMGIELGAYRERKAINATLSSAGTQTTTTTQPQQTTTTTTTTTTAPSTTNPPVTNNNDASTTTTAPSTNAPVATKLPATTEEIVKAYNDAINNTKNTTKAFSATQVENVTMKLVDSTIPSMLQGIVSSVMEGMMGEETFTYSNADLQAFKDNFPPPGKEAALTPAGVKEAKSEPYGDNGYKLVITLVEETATYEVLPTHHSVAVGYLNLDSLGLPFDVQSADFQYAGATVTICVNGDGLVDSYEVDFPMAGTGSGKAMGMTATVTIEGGLDETWNITWQ